jgi:hypothetical protein
MRICRSSATLGEAFHGGDEHGYTDYPILGHSAESVEERG